MKIPFNNLQLQYRGMKAEIDSAIQSVIDEAAFIRGKYVNQFETDYSQAYGVNHCVSCANGTDAIYLVMKALGIGPGDEVITTAMSWISTSETITLTGAKVVFVDMEPDYYCIDVRKIEEKITSRTKAILPVHLYGQPADIDSIQEICQKHRIHLIEDCAQAHFAEYRGKKVGTFGIAGTFSFYPGKNLGAYGDGGAVISDDEELAKKVRMIANHGSMVKHQHHVEGINSRLDGLQAAILSKKLKYIREWNAQRHQIGKQLNDLLMNVPGITTPRLRDAACHIFHLYVIRTPKREELKNYLAQQGIETAIHYPTALPFLKAYEYLGAKPSDFPVAHACQDQILSLPIFPELQESEIETIAASIKTWAQG